MTDVPLDEAGVEYLVARRHGRERSEYGRRPQSLQGGVAGELRLLHELAQALELEERRVALVHVEDRRVEAQPANRAYATDAEHELLVQAVLTVAAVELVRDRPRPRGIAVDVGVEQVQRNATDLHAPHLDADRYELAGIVCELDDGPHLLEREGQPFRVVLRVALGLPVARVELLPEVALAVEEPEADERNAEVRGRFQMVACEHAEAAGVDREARVEAELAREVGDAEPAVLLPALPPRVAVLLLVELPQDALDALQVHGCRPGREFLVGQLGEKRRRVVGERREPLGVELLEQGARVREPREPEVPRDSAQGLAQGGGVVESVHGSSEPFQKDWTTAATLEVVTECDAARAHSVRASEVPRPLLAFQYPESFDRQLGDRVTKRLKSPRARLCAPGDSTGAGAVSDTRQRLEAVLRDRVAVLDGSWGVLIQRELRGEEAYRGERFHDHSHDVAGDPDLLNLTRPEVVTRIHDDYFAAGADIATTNTFTATTIGQADYALGADVVREMNLEGARLARHAADDWTARTPEKPRFVAGAVGPLNVTLSLSPKVEDPASGGHVRTGSRCIPHQCRAP
jgi:hypothetical protein